MIARLLPWIGTGSLAVLVAVLGSTAVSVYQFKPATVSPSVTSGTPAITSQSQTAQPLPRPAIYYAAITDRPLFEPTRRPFVPKPVDVPIEPEIVAQTPPPIEPEMPPPDVLLLGVISSGGSSKALIGVNGGTAIWVSEGGLVADWTLVKVENDWVEISQEERKIRVDMYK